LNTLHWGTENAGSTVELAGVEYAEQKSVVIVKYGAMKLN